MSENFCSLQAWWVIELSGTTSLEEIPEFRNERKLIFAFLHPTESHVKRESFAINEKEKKSNLLCKNWFGKKPKMLKKEKPMMTVAAIIEQAQSRWMDQHPLQVYNRAFQGSYCKYYCNSMFVYFGVNPFILFLFLHHPWCMSWMLLLPFFRWGFKELFRCTTTTMSRGMCVIQLCAHDDIRMNVHMWMCGVWCPQFQKKSIKRETFVFQCGDP